MTLSEIILRKIRSEHQGRERAITREALLDYLRQVADPGLTDRKMRRTIEREIPEICMGPTGYFIADKPEETERTIRYLDKKIYGLAERKRKIKRAYPEFYGRQMELF